MCLLPTLTNARMRRRAIARTAVDWAPCNQNDHFECSAGNKCYAGNHDPRCVGKHNGYTDGLPANTWCWGGNLDFECGPRPSPPAPPHPYQIDGLYYSFQTGHSASDVVDRFELRRSGDSVVRPPLSIPRPPCLPAGRLPSLTAEVGSSLASADLLP